MARRKLNYLRVGVSAALIGTIVFVGESLMPARWVGPTTGAIVAAEIGFALILIINSWWADRRDRTSGPYVDGWVEGRRAMRDAIDEGIRGAWDAERLRAALMAQDRAMLMSKGMGDIAPPGRDHESL